MMTCRDMVPCHDMITRHVMIECHEMIARQGAMTRDGTDRLLLSRRIGLVPSSIVEKMYVMSQLNSCHSLLRSGATARRPRDAWPSKPLL